MNPPSDSLSLYGRTTVQVGFAARIPLASQRKPPNDPSNAVCSTSANRPSRGKWTGAAPPRAGYVISALPFSGTTASFGSVMYTTRPDGWTKRFPSAFAFGAGLGSGSPSGSDQAASG